MLFLLQQRQSRESPRSTRRVLISCIGRMAAGYFELVLSLSFYLSCTEIVTCWPNPVVSDPRASHKPTKKSPRSLIYQEVPQSRAVRRVNQIKGTSSNQSINRAKPYTLSISIQDHRVPAPNLTRLNSIRSSSSSSRLSFVYFLFPCIDYVIYIQFLMSILYIQCRGG